MPAILALQLALCVVAVAGTHAPELRRWSVREFGADGRHYKADTEAFQKAIDQCCRSGGGVVEVPKGTYELGRIHLKDHVTLRLAAGAVLKLAKVPEAFPTLQGDPQSNFRPQEYECSTTCRWSLLYAYRAKNIAIEGSGKIVGDGQAFWEVRNTGDFPKWKMSAPGFYYKAKKFRPFLIMLEQCENVRIRNVTLEDAPVYGALFAGCQQMLLEKVTIRNDLAGPNTDGFHFSSCREVRISDCDFTCGDDCIAIDANYLGPSTKFTVTGCRFTTSVNAFRIFTGLERYLPKERPRQRVSEVSASHCTVRDASGVVNVVAEQGDIARLAFSDFTINMDQRGCALFLLTRRGGAIENVTLRRMRIRTDGIGTISGEDGGCIRNVLLESLQYEVFPRTKLYGNGFPDPVPAYWMAHYAPYNLFVRHARDLTLRNVKIAWQDADLADLDKVPGGTNTWSCIQCRNVQGLTMKGVVCSPFGDGVPAVLLEDVQNAVITGCRATKGTQMFLHVKGNSRNIRLLRNDLAGVPTPYRVDGNAADVIWEHNERGHRP